MPNPNIKVNAGTSGSRFDAEDDSNSEFYITRRVDRDILSFTIVTRNLATGAKSSIPSADFFDAMMEYFHQEGVNIQRIAGDWSNADPALRSNLEQFNNAILGSPADPDEVAATKTFTGRMAGKYGYTEVNWIRRLPPGQRGTYRVVQLYYKRP